MIEVEKKYKVPQDVFDKVSLEADTYADFIDEAEERNVLYNGSTKELHEVYRLRTLHSISGLRATLFTFKRKIDNDFGLKRYEELEFSVNEKTFHEFLVTALNLKPYLVYEKKRKEYKGLAGHTCLDVLPFGTFIELEGSEKWINLLEQEYNLKDYVEQKTYPDLTVEQGVFRDGLYQARFIG